MIQVHISLQKSGISIHAPREGGDWTYILRIVGQPNISIHAPREGGDRSLEYLQQCLVISIHAPREGGDHSAGVLGGAVSVISIHAPREGGDSKDAQFYL